MARPALRIDAVLVQAVIAGALSFAHLHDLAAAAGQDGWKAWAYPISVDLLLVASWRRLRNDGPSRLAWCWFVIALVASLGANVATAGLLDLDHVPAWLRILVAAWPALAFMGGTLLAHSAPEQMPEPPAPTTPATEPVPEPVNESAPEPVPEPVPAVDETPALPAADTAPAATAPAVPYRLRWWTTPARSPTTTAPAPARRSTATPCAPASASRPSSQTPSPPNSPDIDGRHAMTSDPTDLTAANHLDAAREMARRLWAWAHMLGFRGHFSSKSRRYSTTLGALRQARADYRAAQEHAALGLEDVEPDTVLVLADWQYAGHGHTPGESALAATIARDLQLNRETAREALRDQLAPEGAAA
jgi:hypothetical protein